ncbi:MAG: NADP-dependent malic enzyme [Thermovirga sp.]|jgi:malate dehydrogenase (oxaloacetate-decarboxylating)|nr:NADP-dependent malic enzyme [Thermovirga sp.]
MPSKEELLAKAQKPAEDAMKLHPFYKGKMQTAPKCCIRDIGDFAIWYTPGVAAPCKAIKEDVNLSYEYTNRGNMVAVVSDGTRVLGLGDIGPEAGMPVMEGKSLLFKYLGGVDAVAICLDTKDPDKIIEAVRFLAPSFGGINLEDISQPKCFYILDELRKDCKIPVWHDDQQGTAAVNLAGLYSGLKLTDKKIDEVKVRFFGAGAASIATARVLLSAGVRPENVIMADSRGTLHKGRTELKDIPYDVKWHFAQATNPEDIQGGPEVLFKDADVVYCYTKPGPDVVKKEWVATMAKDAMLFACANPIPEIWPWEAKEAGARIVATGRSDFPNQINNSLGFPGIFRGTLDVRATTITDEMCIAAAKALSDCAEREGLSEDYLIPTMDQPWVYPEVAAAVGVKAIEQGIARKVMTREELLEVARDQIEKARDLTRCMMDNKFIEMP